MIKDKKRILLCTKFILVVFIIAGFFSNMTYSYAYSLDTKMAYLKQLQDKLKYDIDNIDKMDNSFQNEFELGLESDIALDKDSAMRFLKEVYSVVPFYNSLTVKKSVVNYKAIFENMSTYDNREVILVAKKWVNEVVEDSMTDREKVRAIHDKIINETIYDLNAVAEGHSPSGVAFEGRAICDGYSRMFAIMLTIIDIPVIQVTSETMNHAFNLVYVDGDWSLVDTTYDDPILANEQVLEYDYFMIDPKSSLIHKYDFNKSGLTLQDYLDIGNYVYSDKIN